MSADSLRERIDALEKAYEYFLGYAAQGLAASSAQGKDGEVRRHLDAGVAALDGLVGAFEAEVESRDKADVYAGFLEALSRDVAASSSAFRIALDQEAITSHLVDNLNASVHVRALLTDLFVLDEALQIPAES